MKQSSKEQSQSDKFKAMAKEVEADGDEKSFDGVLKRLSKVPLAAKKKAKKRPK